MAKVLQHRRGTTAEHANFTGAAGEVTVDTTDKRLVVHDGSTKGGTPMAKKSEIVDAKSELQQAINNAVAEIGGTIDTIEGSIAELRKHNVGEEWVSYTGVIPQGGVPYLGQEVTREMYSDLWAYAQANGLVVSESEWQSLSSSQSGNVGKYSSGNGSTTFRMPRIVGYVKGASSLDEAGAYTKEGLPNIKYDYTENQIINAFVWGDNSTQHNNVGGALYLSSASNGEYTYPTEWVEGVGARRPFGLNFDASRSNPIYGNSSHVTPETSVVLFGVYAFGEVTNAGSVDVQSVANAIARIEADHLLLIGGTVPVGTVVAYAPNSAPSGYLLCNGAEVSRTTYADLFAKIGSTYGAGNGSTTFNLPNLIDRFIQGSGSGGSYKNAGLPNLYGTFSASWVSGDGRLFIDTGDGVNSTGSMNGIHTVTFNAQSYNSIYGASSTVQPPALTMRMYIKY